MKPKPKPEEVELIDRAAFEREAAILFKIPMAEVKQAESQRPKRRPPKRRKKS
ncbi:MAG: hypothetical protein ABSE64_12970 [Vulcanimicrobiaceae bacterium]